MPIKRLVLSCLLILFLFLGNESLAEQASVTANTQEDLARQKSDTAKELEAIESKIRLSQEKKANLKAEMSALEADRAKINRSLIEAASKSRAIEGRIERTAKRLEELRGDENGVRQSLKGKRSLLIEVIAALQRMGHNPPPALLITPEDALSSVRSAILLGAVVPEIKAETEILFAELNELSQIQSKISDSRQSLTNDLSDLAEEEQRLTLLLGEKKKLSNQARQELAKQTALAAELAAKAGNFKGLIAKLESQISSVKDAAIAAEKAAKARALAEEQRIAEARAETQKPNFDDTSRIAPAMAFAKAKGLLPKPVNGVITTSFNQINENGERSEGISIATRSDSRVVSPSDGWVIYAGPFRSYGQLLIINAGDGYHVVLAGMESINVELGQFILAGEPVAIMGSQKTASNGNVDIGLTRPVLYVEFRKDGTSIDPSSWWINTSLEESNG